MKRKSLLLLLLMALFAPFAMNAQTTVEIGDGTSAGYYTPIGTYYNYSITEQLYTADEIGTAGTITSISFYYAYTAAKDFPITVYMANVEATDLSTGISLADAEEVFDGTLSVTEVGWATIDLDTPFAYDGVSNLLIGVNKSQYQWFSGNTWRYTSAANMARYSQNDNNAYDTSTVPGTTTNNRPNIQLVITAGGGSVCERPATMEASNITANSATLTWSGGSGTYNVEYMGGSVTEWTAYLTNTSATTANLSGLTPGTTYQYRVQSVCSNGVSGWKSVSFMTLFGIPFVEEFGTAIPTGWAQYTGLLDNVMADPTALQASTYAWSFGTSNNVFDNHARCNIYSNYQKWLVMPALAMENNVQLMFDLALTVYSSSSNASPTPGAQEDDKFVVLIQTNNGWEVLRQWDNAGSEYVYDNITNTGETVVIDLSSYAGQNIAIAFYGESTETGGDNNLHIDNVSIDYIPACPKPTGLAVNYDGGTTAEVSWTSDATNFNIDVNGTVTNNVSNPYTLTGLDLATTYTVMVQANCGANGLSEWTAPVSFTTDACMPEDLISVNYVLSDSYGDGWNGNAILVVDENCMIVDQLTLESGASASGTVKVCGSYIQFLWYKGSYPQETSWTFTDSEGTVLFSGAGSADMATLDVLYTLDTNPYPMPSDVAASEVGPRSAKLSWTENGTATAWQILLTVGDEEEGTVIDANSNPFVLTGLEPETEYYAQLRSVGSDGTSIWTCLGADFTTTVACPAPSGLAITNLMPTSATVAWTSTDSDIELQYGTMVETVSNELTYAGDELSTAIGIGAGSAFKWAVMFPAGTYTADLMKVSVYDYNTAMTGKLYLYNDGDAAPANQVASTDVTFTGAGAYVDFYISADLDLTKNLWIVFENVSGAAYPAACAASLTSDDPNGQWVELNGTWYDVNDVGIEDDVAWMIKAVFGSVDVEWTSVTNPSNPCNIDGLMSETQYLVQLRANCGSDGYSVWATTSFTTPGLCDMIQDLAVEPGTNTASLSWNGYQDMYNVRYRTVETGDYAFFDDFENGLDNWTIYTNGEVPTGYEGWRIIDLSVSLENVDAYSGTHAASAWSWSTSAYNADNWLVTPQLDLKGILRFMVRTNAGYPDHYEVLLSTTDNTTESFTVTLQEMATAPAVSAWTEVTIDLNAYAGQTGYIAIHHVDYDANYLLIDDFGIMSDIIPAGEWVEIQVEGSPCTIEGLVPETTYEVQVQGVCSETETTEWTDLVTFTTISACTTPTNLVAEPSATSAELSWSNYQESYNLYYRYQLPGDPTAPATVILTAPDIWEDGSGYQMLLDADATAYGTIIPTTGALTSGGDVSDEIYAEFEYKIPVDADGALTTENIVINNSIAIEIPAGTYDWCITNPTPEDRMWIAASNGIGGRYDDFVFEAGKTYEFTVVRYDQNDGVDLLVGPMSDWTMLDNVTTPYTLTGLTPNTYYEWKVEGVNKSCEGGVTEQSEVQNFTTLEAPSTVEQTLELSAGWTWMSVYLEASDELFEAIKDGIAENNTTAMIKDDKGGSLMLQGANGWQGELDFINEGMYMTNFGTPVTLNLTAAPADPAAHPITIATGWNWIGFISSEPMTVEEAMSNITPNNDDLIKSTDGSWTYSAGSWVGELPAMEPGQGYMYYNRGAEMTLVYPASAKGVVRSLPVEKYWSTNVHEHATNLVVMATLDESQFAMGEGNYEIGAFVNGECRGSSRLLKTSNGYVALVLVHGEYDETISFKLYDVTNAMVVGSSEEQLRYVSNAIVGSVEEPMVLHFRGITDVNEEGNSLSVFPNPTKDNVKIQGQAIETVSVYNALGQCLINETYGNATDLELNLSGLSAGVYTVSIRTNGTVINKLVVKE